MELIPISLTGLPPEMMLPVLFAYVLLALIKTRQVRDDED